MIEKDTDQRTFVDAILDRLASKSLKFVVLVFLILTPALLLSARMVRVSHELAVFRRIVETHDNVMPMQFVFPDLFDGGTKFGWYNDLLSKIENSLHHADLVMRLNVVVYLGIHDSKLENESIELIKEFRYLRHLNLSNSQVTEKQLFELVPSLPCLDGIQLHDTNVSAETVKKLRVSFPNIQVDKE